MQALVFRGVRNIQLEDVPEPTLKSSEVLVEVDCCGICGSDLHGFLGYSPRRTAHIPLVMGHEFSGRVVQLGAEAGDAFAVGSRVVVQPQICCGRCRACRSGRTNICPNMAILGIELPGAFAERVAVPVDRVFSIPEHLQPDVAAMTETLAVEVHLFRAFAAPLLRTVVILGAGAQGLLAVQLARLGGAEQIIVSDILPERLAMAGRMGATTLINARQSDPVERVLQLTDRWGADLVVDAAGAPKVRVQGAAMLAPGATLALVGLGEGETHFNFLPVVGKELTIRGSYCYTDDDFARALELLVTGAIDVQPMLHTGPLAEGATYFDRLIDEPGGLTKVVLSAQ